MTAAMIGTDVMAILKELLKSHQDVLEMCGEVTTISAIDHSAFVEQATRIAGRNREDIQRQKVLNKEFRTFRRKEMR